MVPEFGSDAEAEAFRNRMKQIVADPESRVDDIINGFEVGQHDLKYRCRQTGWNWIFLAAQRRFDDDGALELIKYFHGKGVDPCLVDKQCAFSCKQTPIFFAAAHGLVKTAEYLVKVGSDPAMLDCNQQNALFYASRHGFLDMMTFLINQGVDPNVTDAMTQTALFYAACDGGEQACQLLMDRGADAGIKDHAGRTAAENAKASLQILERQINKRTDRTNFNRVQAVLTGKPLGTVPTAAQGGSHVAAKRRAGPHEAHLDHPQSPQPNKRYKYRILLKDERTGTQMTIDDQSLADFEAMFPDIAQWPRPKKVQPWYEKATALVDEAIRHESAPHLLSFEETLYPQYNQIMTDKLGPDWRGPMDLMTIRKKLDEQRYVILADLRGDFELMIKNCIEFHGNSSEVEVIPPTKRLQSWFRLQWGESGLLDMEEKELEPDLPVQPDAGVGA